MSDYTSTFTEGTGDTIDTSDFSTEFDAIETAIATKYDSNDFLDEDNMASNSDTKIASQQSIKAYADAITTAWTAAVTGSRLVLFDELQSLVSYSTTSTSGWTTFDMSAAGGDAATAATAGATSAILHLKARFTHNGGISAGFVTVNVAEGGTTPTNRQYAEASADDGYIGSDTCVAICPLDGNSDFNYNIIVDDASFVDCEILLAGYYY